MITEKAVTSVAVPDVDGIAANFAFCRNSGKPNGVIRSSNFVFGYS